MSFVMDENGVLTNTLTAQDSLGLQNDLVLIDQLISAIYADAAWVQINRRQMNNAQKRLLFVHKLLKQLPNPRPSPPIISVVRSLAFMVQQCSLDDTWPRLLRDYFTCEVKFIALRARLRAVWKMHSTTAWEDEDHRAATLDAVDDATLLLRLMSLPAAMDADHVVAYYTRHALSAWRLPFEALERVSDSSGVTHTARSSREGDDDDEEGDRATSMDSPRIVIPSSLRNNNAEGEEEKVMDTVNGGLSRSPCARRFVVQRGFRHHGQPVVVKVLEEENDAEKVMAEVNTTEQGRVTEVQAMLSTETVMAFIQDAVTRVSWCHPDLVECYGAFTEKFVIDKASTETTAKVTTTKNAAALFNVEAEKTHMQDAETKNGDALNVGQGGEHMKTTVLQEVPEVSVPGVMNAAASIQENVVLGHRIPDGHPRLALGLVLEDMTPMQSRKGHKNGRTSNTTVHFASTPPTHGTSATVLAPDEGECECLHDILFVHRRRFTVRESIDILLQMADVIQYIMLDADKVPEGVVQAWLSIAPSNIYLVPLKPTDSLTPKPNSAEADPLAGTSTGDAVPRHTALAREPLGYIEGSTSVDPFGVRSASSTTFGASSSTLLPSSVPRPSSSTVFVQQVSEEQKEWRPVGRTPPAVCPARLLQDLSAGTALNAQKSFADSLGGDNYYNGVMGESTRPALLQRSSSLMPIAMRGSCGIRYSPPCYIAAGPSSRWRPHPQATSPACYALAQLLLALLTNRVPYAAYRRQAELRERVFGAAARGRSTSTPASSATSSPATTTLPVNELRAYTYHSYGVGSLQSNRATNMANNSLFSSTGSMEDEVELGRQGAAVKMTVMPGYILPGDLLPPELRRLFRRAMSFDRTQRPMTLQELRENLWCAREEVQRLGLHRLRWPNTNNNNNGNAAGSAVEMAEPAPAPDDYGEV